MTGRLPSLIVALGLHRLYAVRADLVRKISPLLEDTMKLRSTALFALLAALLCTVVQAQDGFEKIFDGKSLEGWKGNDAFWSVKDGAITGQTTAENPTKGNTFLIWQGGEVGDFELRLKFKIEGGNSGIQYRSVDKGNHVVNGYQADIDSGLTFMGILYEEGGRGILAQRGKKVEITEKGEKKELGTTTPEKEILDSIKKDDWNEYVVIAKGNQLTQKINGHTTIELTDQQSEKAKASGILALQLHAGPPMKVQFKDIELLRN